MCLTCKKYGPTYALADKNNNIITVWGKDALYKVAQTYRISNATINVTKGGNIKIGRYPIALFTKSYHIADAWTGFYDCQ